MISHNEKHNGRLEEKIFENRIEEDEYLTVEDVSKLLKVPRKTIYGWIYRKQIQPIKLGPRLLRFSRSYIDQWVSQKGDSHGSK